MSDSLAQIGILLVRVILPVTIVIGVAGNSFNIAVLTRPALYRHACSRYFLALATNNLFYSGIVFIHRLLSSGYQINVANYSVTSCKIINYITTISAFLSPYFIVCASIDRYCVTSISPQIRKFSCIRVTKWMIFMIFAVYLLLFINILVLANIQPERGFSCAVQASSLYSQVYIITQVFLYAVIPPSLMILFGLLTIQNSNRSRVDRIAASRFNRTERQLARMLFLQVSVHILLTLPTSVTFLMTALPNIVAITTSFSFISTIFSLLFNFSYVTPFFLYVLSGRIYRNELLRLVHVIFRIRCGNQIEPLENQNIALPVISLAHPQQIV
jgi:hypothetical protein